MAVRIGRVVSAPDAALSARVHHEMRISGITSQQPINRKTVSAAITDVFDNTWQGRCSGFWQNQPTFNCLSVVSTKRDVEGFNQLQTGGDCLELGVEWELARFM